MGKWALPVVALAAAAIVGTSAAATGLRSARGVEATPHASIVRYLGALGIRVHAERVVVQRGRHNYVGTNCPGITWTCTTPANGKLVVQFAKKDDSNQFVCTPSSAGPQPGPNDCTVVQVADGGNNDAQCVERTNATTGVTQNCTIEQTNTTGDNHAQVSQQVTANGGAVQAATQNASVSQKNGSGKNDAHLRQSIEQRTNDSGPGGAQSQDGNESAAVGQQSDTGDNHADVDQSLDQNEHLGPAGGKNAVQTVAQAQDANGGGPNLNGAVYQTSNSGNLDGSIDQSIDEHAEAPGKNVIGSQTQGHAGGGVNGHFDQTSQGVAKAKGTQREHQDFGGSSKTLTQTQFDPAWMGSPQQLNTDDKYDIDQHTEQNASNDVADQHDQIFSNCDTSGTCTAKEDTNQDGTHQRNSCSGSVCHIATSCESGGDEPGCRQIGPCDGPCEGAPPPAPENPLGGAGESGGGETGGPAITGVSFSGTDACCNGSSPTVTVSGSGFGAEPPSGQDDSVTGCGTYAGNGDAYGDQFYVDDSHGANDGWEAGRGVPPNANCVGVVVVSWSDTQVVYRFGSSYDSFANWYLSNGDTFTQHLEGASFTGTVAGLTSPIG